MYVMYLYDLFRILLLPLQIYGFTECMYLYMYTWLMCDVIRRMVDERDLM
jgi:hypothetical protein